MSAVPRLDAAPRADGRSRRSARSRRAIVEALLALVREGAPAPTAQQVADRAGVGLRTVFRHFEAMEDLFAEMAGRVRAEIEPLLRGDPPPGDAAARLRDLVQRRARVFERALPYRRSTEIQRWHSPFLERQLRADARELRGELRRWLPELDAGRREALDAVLSIELWVRLRVEQRLGARRAAALVERIALALLRGGPATEDT